MLEINNLRKEYKDFTLDCSFSVKTGRITGLVGQNGAGKTTCFKAILGLISTDGGTINVMGKDVTHFTNEDKEKIGAALSDSGFSGYFTVKDIVPILASMYSEFDFEYFIKQIEKLGLPLDKKINKFSNGMKAKLKLIVALSHNGKLLILDEPTAGLDVVARDEILSLLRDYMEANEDRAILISSHISSDLETLCDDIYMINNGKIILHEDTDVLLSDYALIKLSAEQFEEIDKDYLLYYSKEAYGYDCLTKQKQFYHENYPQLVIERGTIDNIIKMIIRGTRL